MIDHCEPALKTYGVGGTEIRCTCIRENRKTCPTCHGTGRYFWYITSRFERKQCVICANKNTCFAGRYDPDGFVLHNLPRMRT